MEKKPRKKVSSNQNLVQLFVNYLFVKKNYIISILDQPNLGRPVFWALDPFKSAWESSS